MPSYSIIILSYDDGEILIKPLNSALSSNAREIVLVCGGKIPISYLDNINDSRFIKLVEGERTGKASAIMKGIKYIKSDVIFIISGDVQFDPVIFESMMSRFDSRTGVVVPKVTVLNSRNIWEKSCKVLWDIHDSQLRVMTSLSLPAHGGELLATRAEILSDFMDVINDDAFICLKALEKGYRIYYSDDSEVRSLVPSNFFQIIDQRRRIIYGHIQLSRIGLDPMVMDTLVFTDLHLFMKIFIDFLKNSKRDLIYLPVTIFTETISLILARIDYASSRSHKLWKIIPRNAL